MIPAPARQTFPSPARRAQKPARLLLLPLTARREKTPERLSPHQNPFFFYSFVCGAPFFAINPSLRREKPF
jgi:hypothetical protein